jgi:hypothetical protein
MLPIVVQRLTGADAGELRLRLFSGCSPERNGSCYQTTIWRDCPVD